MKGVKGLTRMERLSHDLNLALEESNCGRQERRKLGLRRRTRSAGNLPACVASLVEDGSSSSPPQAPLITQPLSDSDEPQAEGGKGARHGRHYCQNIESDSFNENFSPTRPANARRKRKYKKMAVDYVDGNRSSPVEILTVTQTNSLAAAVIIQNQGLSPISQINKKKRIFKQDRNAFCGKRKWSHRDRCEMGEMRERSFSGGCTSKSYFFGKNYIDFKTGKKYGIDKMPKYKEKLLNPGKIILKATNIESKSTIEPSAFSIGSSLPGSSSFNFVYKNPLSKHAPSLHKVTGFKITTDLPPFFNPAGGQALNNNNFVHKNHRKSKSLNKTHPQDTLRNPLQFDEGNGMECAGAEFLSSSSLSSSDSDGVVTNDSDREGDDELTDWPGSEEISAFNKTLNFKTTRSTTNGTTKPNNLLALKPAKKDKFLPKHGLASFKNKDKPKSLDLDSTDAQLMDDDTMMSDSGTILEAGETESHLRPDASFASFSDVKNAGGSGRNANENFYHSFLAYQEKTFHNDDTSIRTPRSNFSLQKTSSSDLNLSEKSPQSDHYYSEHSLGKSGATEVREIRAGCRRVRDERPGFVILSAANEQLSRFLQDSCQTELKLPCVQHDPDEQDKLESLAKLYSLELQVEMGRPVLRKTCNTTQAIRVEHSRMHRGSALADYKRRCYDPDPLDPLDPPPPHKDSFTSSLVNEALLDPGEID